MAEIILKEESYALIGICMEVHREMGMGFKEVIYNDAISIELQRNQIPFEREKRFIIAYTGIILPHKYYADFVVNNSIILEVKSVSFIVNNFLAQTKNYLKASGLKLEIIVNFGQKSLTYKRIVF